MHVQYLSTILHHDFTKVFVSLFVSTFESDTNLTKYVLHKTSIA